MMRYGTFFGLRFRDFGGPFLFTAMVTLNLTLKTVATHTKLL